jgi:hypothetical protein
MRLMGALNMVDDMVLALSHVDTTETGGALVVVRPEIARQLKRALG